jgi:hypothetical protein
MVFKMRQPYLAKTTMEVTEFPDPDTLFDKKRRNFEKFKF